MILAISDQSNNPPYDRNHTEDYLFMPISLNRKISDKFRHYRRISIPSGASICTLVFPSASLNAQTLICPLGVG